MELPAALEPHRADLEKSRKKYIKATPQKLKNVDAWASKVGGVPYLPKGEPLPTTPDGKELFFLAQINFAEMPALAPFPTAGILQFFISDDSLLGMDSEFDEQEVQDTFRVRWFPQVEMDSKKLDLKFNPLRPYDYLPHHPEESYPLKFAVADEIAPVADYQFYQIFGQDFFEKFEEKEWEVYAEFEKIHRSTGHKLGGYAYFTQDDPRSAADPMLLLFQLDSDELMDLQWGDMGVGHFFIRESDLVARDFSRVRYSWDCL